MAKLAKGESFSLIVNELREEILDGRLAPGERLHQPELATRFGTSRQPVREALRELQAEGLINVLSNAGARVARLDAEELDEVYWLRELLEPRAVKRSAPNLSDEDVAFLETCVADMEACSDDQERQREWWDLDRSFHFRSFAGLHLPRTMQLIEGFWNAAQQYRRAYIVLHAEAMKFSNAEHRLILDALQRRSGDDAAQLLEVHIRRTRLGLRKSGEIFNNITT